MTKDFLIFRALFMNTLVLKPDRCILKGGNNQLLIIIAIMLREIATETGYKKCCAGRN